MTTWNFGDTVTELKFDSFRCNDGVTVSRSISKGKSAGFRQQSTPPGARGYTISPRAFIHVINCFYTLKVKDQLLISDTPLISPPAFGKQSFPDSHCSR